MKDDGVDILVFNKHFLVVTLALFLRPGFDEGSQALVELGLFFVFEGESEEKSLFL